ncbi:MAG: hypothetical protein EA390_15170, partial [Balneolaceae bacterium]
NSTVPRFHAEGIPQFYNAAKYVKVLFFGIAENGYINENKWKKELFSKQNRFSHLVRCRV